MNKFEFLHKDSGISSEDLKKTIKNLDGYRERVNTVAESGGYDADEASINLSIDGEISDRVNSLVARLKTDKLLYIIVVGIGGSNLGTKAIYEGVFGQADVYNKIRRPKIIFVDTLNHGLISEVQNIISQIEVPEEIVLNVITKSGTTTESIVNFEIIFESLKKH
ncbi:MAG TPA: hypothetical protein ENI66_01480, partial [Candidatus Yonathbacteria bacterium]|nr:hypothetical protein [Candidatus Yonathbacteria bacterium]